MINDRTAKEYFHNIREAVRTREQDLESKQEAEYHKTLEKLSDCIQKYEEQKDDINERFKRRMQVAIG